MYLSSRVCGIRLRQYTGCNQNQLPSRERLSQTTCTIRSLRHMAYIVGDRIWPTESHRRFVQRGGTSIFFYLIKSKPQHKINKIKIKKVKISTGQMRKPVRERQANQTKRVLAARLVSSNGTISREKLNEKIKRDSYESKTKIILSDKI